MLISCTFEKNIYFHALGFQSFAVLVLIMFISSYYGKIYNVEGFTCLLLYPATLPDHFSLSFTAIKSY